MSPLDQLFFRKYDEDNYNCAHLVCEAWLILYKADISELLHSMLEPFSARHVNSKHRRKFKRLKTPCAKGCIIQMRNRGYGAHVGLYLNGYVLQINENFVEYQPLEIASRGFNVVSFYSAPKGTT